MGTVTDPSNYFLTMRTLGNLLTVSLRNGSFYIKKKSAPTSRTSATEININHTFYAKLAEFQAMTEEQREALDNEAALYYTNAFTLLLSLGFKAFMSSKLGMCQLGCAMCGGNVR